MPFASSKVKCLLHHESDYMTLMSDASDRLREVRERAGYENAKDAAEAMNIPVPTYIQHENGTRGYPATKAKKYAQFFRTTPEWLLYGRDNGLRPVNLGPQLYVKGAVAAGVWNEATEASQDEWEAFTGLSSISAPINNRYGLRVEGESMDQIYPSGTIVECVAYYGDDIIPNGKRVIVERYSFKNGVESTVKEYFKDSDGIEWLIPRSNNPAFQSPIRCDEPGPDIEKIVITAIVVASIRPE